MRRGSTTVILVIALLALGLGWANQAIARSGTAAGSASGDQLTRHKEPTGISPTLYGVVVNHTNERSRVVLLGNAPLPYTSFMSYSPPKLIVEITALAQPQALGLTEVNEGVIKQIEVTPISDQPGIHRVRIDLKQETRYEIKREKQSLVVIMDNPAPAVVSGDGNQVASRESGAPGMTGPSRITGLDFKPLNENMGSRLAVTTTMPVKPKILTRDEGKTIVLSLSPVRIADQFLRPLDTRYFTSAVDYVQPSRINDRTVNLTIRLREAVPYHLNQEGPLTYIDFDPSAQPPKEMPLSRQPAAEKAMAPAEKAMTESDQAAAGTTPTEESLPGMEAGAQKSYSGPRISLDFQNADIHHVLRLIGEVGSKNVVISDRVKGMVTLRLKNVPWQQALDLVLLSQDLGVKLDGDVMRIETLDHLADEKKRQLDHLMSERKIRQEAMQLQLEEQEVLVRRIWTPKYASVDRMMSLLTPLKSERGSIKLIGNDIFIEEREDVLRLMEAVFNKNDTVAKQILIEARIVEALTSFSKNLGVNWGGTWEDKNKNLGGIFDPDALSGSLKLEGLHGASQSAINLISPPSVGLGLGLVFSTAALNLNAQLYAMEQTGEGRIISAPRILANNDQEVYIKQGSAIPFETVGTLTEPSKIDYKEAELKLAVTPHIEENGEIITMQIMVTKDTPDYSLTTRNPPINTREASTKLMVRDGETVVIGGIIIDEKSKSTNQVPGVHKLPILGWLFKNYEVQDSKTELLIFITAHIIPVTI